MKWGQFSVKLNIELVMVFFFKYTMVMHVQFCAHFKLVRWSHLTQMKHLVSLLSCVLSERNSQNSWTGLSFLSAPLFLCFILQVSALAHFIHSLCLVLMLLLAASFSSFSDVLRQFLLLSLFYFLILNLFLTKTALTND